MPRRSLRGPAVPEALGEPGLPEVRRLDDVVVDAHDHGDLGLPGAGAGGIRLGDERHGVLPERNLTGRQIIGRRRPSPHPVAGQEVPDAGGDEVHEVPGEDRVEARVAVEARGVGRVVDGDEPGGPELVRQRLRPRERRGRVTAGARPPAPAPGCGCGSARPWSASAGTASTRTRTRARCSRHRSRARPPRPAAAAPRWRRATGSARRRSRSR